MSFRFNNRLSSGKFGKGSARNIFNAASLHKGYLKWRQKLHLIENALESDIPVKRVYNTRSMAVSTSPNETVEFWPIQQL